MIPFEEIVARARELAARHQEQQEETENQLLQVETDDVESPQSSYFTASDHSNDEADNLTGGAVTRSQAATTRNAAIDGNNQAATRNPASDGNNQSQAATRNAASDNEAVSDDLFSSDDEFGNQIDRVPGTSLYKRAETVAENESFKILVSKEGFKKWRNFYDSARFLLRIEYKVCYTYSCLLAGNISLSIKTH
jgi:hypothetical protein